MNITFDSTEIVNGDYVPKYAKHETVADRVLNMLELAREDGAVLVNDKYGVKKIVIRGTITGSSQSNLESKIDTFKELFSRTAKTLAISWAGGTRNYIAYCSRHEFNRDYVHLFFCPWVAEFIVPEGFGRETTEEAYNSSFSGHTENEIASVSEGSKAPKPYEIRISPSLLSASGEKGISFSCGGKKLIYTQSSDLSQGDILVINCEDGEVTLNGNEVGFFGPFPLFDLGNNSFSVEIGEISVAGDWGQGGSGEDVYDTKYKAQSFVVPWKDESFQVISANISATGSPPNGVTLRVETDDGGKPSGTLADVNATVTVASASLPDIVDKYKFQFANAFTLEANTRYWLVVQTSGGDASNHYNWVKTTDHYNNGNSAYSNNSGTDWTDEPDNDYNFEIYVGGKRGGTVNNCSVRISYYPYFL